MRKCKKITWSLSVHELEVFPRAVLGVADLDARDGGSGALVLSGGGERIIQNVNGKSRSLSVCPDVLILRESGAFRPLLAH